MLDIFPTVLELLGYRLKNGRAGLGYSLISNAPNLVENHGADLVNDAIYANSALQEAIWASSKISTVKLKKVGNHPVIPNTGKPTENSVTRVKQDR